MEAESLEASRGEPGKGNQAASQVVGTICAKALRWAMMVCSQKDQSSWDPGGEVLGPFGGRDREGTRGAAPYRLQEGI